MLRAVALPQIDKRAVVDSQVTPRRSVGRVIHQRRHWRLDETQLPGANTPRGSFAEYLRAWRWKTHWDMPDQLFIRVPGEAKPLFVDFRSPLSVDTFLRDIAGCERLDAEEMLPGFDRLWLRIDGERYCSELRLTAFRTPGRG
jgi:hypothetical protein